MATPRTAQVLSVSFLIISVSYYSIFKGFDILFILTLLGANKRAMSPYTILHDAKVRKIIHTKKYFGRKILKKRKTFSFTPNYLIKSWWFQHYFVILHP